MKVQSKTEEDLEAIYINNSTCLEEIENYVKSIHFKFDKLGIIGFDVGKLYYLESKEKFSLRYFVKIYFSSYVREMKFKPENWLIFILRKENDRTTLFLECLSIQEFNKRYEQL